MRAILSISMPETKKKEVEKRAAKLGLGVSKYILHCVELEKDVISEDELVRLIKSAKKEYKKGDTKEFKTLPDLTLE